MKRMHLVLALLAAGVVVLPARAAAPPPKRVAQLERQVAALRAEVRKLEARNRRLSLEAQRLRAQVSTLAAENAGLRGAMGRGVCPVTLPNGLAPTGERSSGGHHGNGALTVALWDFGVVAAGDQFVLPDGRIRMKYPWWRDVSGQLRIEGRRLDGRGTLTANVPDGYGAIGFQATDIVFSSEGCWEITGRVGDASLTFVNLVIRVRGGGG